METTKTPSVKTEIIDPSIEHALPENCNMSILFKEDGLVFSILRNDLRKFIVLGEYELKNDETNISSLFYFREQLQGAFSNYSIGYSTQQFTIIPASLFSPERLEEYAKFQFELKLNAKLRFDELKTHGVVIIYSIPIDIESTVNLYFPGIQLHHLAAFTISYYLNLYKNKPGEHIHAQIWRGHVEVLAVRNGKLILFNSFKYETNEDLLYFLMNTYEQLELNPEVVPLKVSGELEKHDKMWELLLTYIRFVELEENPNQYKFSHEFGSLQSHRYNRIFQAATCVL